MRYRAGVGIGFIIVTLGFASGIPGVEIRTIFNDLLPRDDPFVQVFFDHRNFGNPLTMSIMVKRKHGDIYNSETLRKVWKLTRDMDLAPGIDHDQLISISTEKLRYAEATTDGIDSKPLMSDVAPSTDAEMAEFRRRVDISPSALTFYISNDETATLINVGFQDTVEYGKAFDHAQNLVEQARDAEHDVYLAGQPALTGWVYRLQKQTYNIFGVTILALMISLVFYMRNVAGVVTPIACATVAGLWGFGFIGWLGRPIEPLLMIVPLLLVARSFSHCVQFTERYYEVLTHLPDRRKAAEVTMGIMMAPSILGIMTDVFGIVFIAIAPIETMVNHAIFCGFWAFWIIPTGTFMVSIILSYMPVPKNITEIVGGEEKESGIHLVQDKALKVISRTVVGKAAKYSTVVLILIAVWAFYTNSQIKIGNPVEGSNILWYDSEFNTAVRAINDHFPGMNTLEIVLEATTENKDYRIARTPEVAAVSAQLQRIIETDPDLVPRATLSFTDYMSATNRLYAGGNPKWMALDPTLEAVSAAGIGALFGSSPINFLHVTNFDLQHSTVTLWYKDNKQETVDAALASARRAIDIVGTEHREFRIRLGTGVIALQQAMNSVVERYHWFILGLLNCAVMVISAYAYRSLVAALILLIPVNISNLLLGATMHTLGIGLDINAVIVAVMGVGIGIDYGIYLLSRICEEYSAHDHDLTVAIRAALTTTGKAIMFTASVMLIGILPWYFLSDLKFMADMGLLLVAIMLINMVLSLVALPLLVWLIKPKFMARDDLLVGENVDISQFTTE
jgi:predicted RND superfamily exporter protein